MKTISPDQIAIFRDAQRDVLKQRLIETEVCEYFSVIFSPRGVETLTEQDIKGFMSFRQNKRWREISRDDVAEDMEALRATLTILFDETRPIAERINLIEPGVGINAIAHLGKAKMTPLLLVTHPKQYGVWNDYSERAMIGIGVYPDLSHVPKLGDQYQLVNQALLKLCDEYRVSLWRLDMILEQIARLVR